MRYTVNGYPLKDLVGPPDATNISRRLAQVRAAIAGKLACVGAYTDERYELVGFVPGRDCVVCGKRLDLNESDYTGKCGGCLLAKEG